MKKVYQKPLAEWNEFQIEEDVLTASASAGGGVADTDDNEVWSDDWSSDSYQK